MSKKRIGIDVGGTNVKIALVTDEGQIIYSNSVPTRAEMGYEYTVNNIKQAIYDLMKETKTATKDIEGIGFGFPGQVDCENGVVKLLPNIPGWVNVPIAKILEEEFHIPTKIDNDARCAALGELFAGAGKKIDKAEKKQVKADISALQKLLMKKPDKMTDSDLDEIRRAIGQLQSSSANVCRMPKRIRKEKNKWKTEKTKTKPPRFTSQKGWIPIRLTDGFRET